MTLQMRDQENIELGRKQGLEQGMKRGTERFAALMRRMRADGRGDDMDRCIEDAAFCEQLFNEYDL